MARSVTIGNGNLLVGLDLRGQVRDLYFPFVGESNHVSGASGNFVHRIGVFVDGRISWLDDPAWKVTGGIDEESSVGSIFAENMELGISIASRDAVHNEHNVFLRHFTIHNHRSETREVKLFLSQQFRIYESRRGDTGFYDTVEVLKKHDYSGWIVFENYYDRKPLSLKNNNPVELIKKDLQTVKEV
jgi:GH15 family glucan-1,4-alpha-glucosidase